MPPETPRPAPARVDALAELAAEAARFAEGPPDAAPPAPVEATRAAPRSAPRREAPPRRTAERRPRPPARVAPASDEEPGEVIPGYMPNAVAPERGNTRPAVPVDGRLHLRAAPAAVEGLDEVVHAWRSRHPTELRDLERATLIRIGIGIVLADVVAHGERGLVGEAVRAALDPAQRHLAVAMPDPRRWLRERPERREPEGAPG